MKHDKKGFPALTIREAFKNYRVSKKKAPIKVSAGYFRNFPSDVNLNTLDLESFGYTMEHFKYGWKDGSKSVQCTGQGHLHLSSPVASQDEIPKYIGVEGNLYSRFVAIFPAILEVLHGVAILFSIGIIPFVVYWQYVIATEGLELNL